MARYMEKVKEITDVFKKAGENLVREGILLNYSIVKNIRENEEPVDWKEKPAVYGVYEFKRQRNLFLIMSATLDKEYSEEQNVFILTHELLTELPDFKKYRPSIDGKSAYIYNHTRLEGLIKGIVARS
ncbi:MAG: hypothetical protein QW484_01565 [Candidatus Pacearchaeota archaeon]